MFQQDQLDIAADYGRAWQAGPTPDSAEVRAIPGGTTNG
ncbi:hypothetical protein [Nocardia carnea]